MKRFVEAMRLRALSEDYPSKLPPGDFFDIEDRFLIWIKKEYAGDPELQDTIRFNKAVTGNSYMATKMDIPSSHLNILKRLQSWQGDLRIFKRVPRATALALEQGAIWRGVIDHYTFRPVS